MFKYILLVALVLTVAAAQNTTTCTTKTSCTSCLSTSGCFYCSSLGCRPDTTTDRQACTQGEGSAVAPISACPDNCYNPDNTACTDCLNSNTCGYCSGSGTCMTGTASGPTYKSCSSGWHFANSSSPLKDTQACSAFQSCAAITNCNSCTSTAQDANTPCNWCSTGSCVAGKTCPSGATLQTSCPTPDMSDASVVAVGVVSFAGLMAALSL